jgi:hypothetical protein
VDLREGSTRRPGKAARRGIFIYAFLDKHRSRDIAVGVLTGLRAGRAGNRDSLPSKGKQISSSRRLKRLWGTPRLFFNVHWEAT